MLTELLFLVVIVSAFCIGMAAGYALATKHVKEMVLEAEALSTPFWDEIGTPSFGNLAALHTPIEELNEELVYEDEPDDTVYVDSYYDYLDDEEARYEAWQEARYEDV